MDLVQARPGRTVEVPRCAVAKAVAVAGDELEGGRRRAGRGRGLPETRDGGGGLPRSRGITRRPETREGDGGGPSPTREGGAMEAAARWRSRARKLGSTSPVFSRLDRLCSGRRRRRNIYKVVVSPGSWHHPGLNSL